MKRITTDQILMFYKKMISRTGGLEGLRDRNILESSVYNAFATFDGIDLYKSTEEKCSNICYSIIKNHPFTDGNKRMGIYIMLVLLKYNDIVLEYKQAKLVELGLRVANGEYTQIDIQKWIEKHKV